MLAEFLATDAAIQAPRKLTLGTALNRERAALTARLLANAMSACDDPIRRRHWERLYAIEQRIAQALFIDNPDLFRKIAAKVIFRGEELPHAPDPEPGAGTGGGDAQVPGPTQPEPA